MFEATIEDFDRMIRSSRESDRIRRRGCIEHDGDKGIKVQTITGTEA